MSRHGLIRAVLDAVALSGALRAVPKRPSSGFVVTLHHVQPARPAGAFWPTDILSVTPTFLDHFVVALSRAGWRFVSLQEILDPAEAGDAKRIAVTLDDGYRDNAVHALPVFARHRVPFTVYVCAGFCDRSSELWWEALERIVAAAERMPAPGGSASLETRTFRQKRHVYRAWLVWLTTVTSEREQRTAIRALASDHGIDLAALAAELVMSWDDVRCLARDPLCTIGAHTLTHPALARLDAEEALREMAGSADRIAAEIGRRPSSVAFPYGYKSAAGEREARLARDAGLDSSFTTQPGFLKREWLTPEASHGLPRVSINGVFQHERYFGTLLDPRFWAIREKLVGPAPAGRRVRQPSALATADRASASR